MPRKPKKEPFKANVIIDGKAIVITLHPPKGTQKSWYVYWAGLPNSKSTGQWKLVDAIAVGEQMLRNGGKRAEDMAVMSDDEFIELQRVHFQRRQSPDDLSRADKSFRSCVDAIEAFKQISKLPRICLATPDDCAHFQREAVKLPKNWRLKYPRSKTDGVPLLSANTVNKWSRALTAAFERANVHAEKRKCVRGVVPTDKLLPSNPWKEITLVEGVEGKKRQFSDEELVSILDYFEKAWAGISTAIVAVKTCLWMWARVSELASLKWTDVRGAAQERHFRSIGKWGIEKWARIPDGLFKELEAVKKPNSDYVFAAYCNQLRAFYSARGQGRFANLVGDEFSPTAFASWLQERISDWSVATNHPHATPHAFRRTTLQHAMHGAEIGQQVATDASIGAETMLTWYVNVRDQEHRLKSNRTFQRILLSLSSETALRFGYEPANEVTDLELRIRTATIARDWQTVEKIARQLAKHSSDDEAA